MPQVKHCLIPDPQEGPDNQAMLKSEMKSKWRANRLRSAMRSATPPIRPADLVRTCGVSPQVVNGWLTTGRIDKKYLATIAQAINQPIEYLIDEASPPLSLTFLSPSGSEPFAMKRRGQSTREVPGEYVARDKRLQRIVDDWHLLSDMDQRRIHNDVVQKAQHVRDKIKEHEKDQPGRFTIEQSEKPHRSVIDKVFNLVRNPKKPRQ